MLTLRAIVRLRKTVSIAANTAAMPAALSSCRATAAIQVVQRDLPIRSKDASGPMEFNEAQSSPSLKNAAAMGAPSHTEIAVRANWLSLEQGQPPDSQTAIGYNRREVTQPDREVHERAGSVQN